MGLINLYNHLNNEHKTIRGSGTVRDILKDYDLSHALIIKAGDRVTPDYEITEDDILYCRMFPAGSKAETETAAAVGSVAVGVGLGSTEFDSSNISQAEILQYDPDAITKAPFLKGAKNQSALGKAIPFIMGNVRFAPYTLNDGYFTIEGDNGEKQFYNVPLLVGYNNQLLDSISIGDSVIKTFDNSANKSQDNFETITINQFDELELSVSTGGELLGNTLNEKVIGQAYSEEVKHDYGKDAEPVIKELSENARAVEICIKFDGLRKYNESSGTYEAKKVKIVPYWSNNADAASPTWNSFCFDIPDNSNPTYEEVELTADEKAEAIEDGYILEQEISISYGTGGQTRVKQYISNDAFYRVEYDGSDITQATLSNWKMFKKEQITSDVNEIERCTNSTIRFIATKQFTASESYGKKITIKVVKETATENSNTNETCILEFINTYCYDALKSSESELVACSPLENPYRDSTLRLGLKIPATEKTDNILDEISVKTTGMAKVYLNGEWTNYKKPTRNPAAIALELLTSNVHNKSQYSDSALDLDSFAEFYSYCEDEEFYCDGVITEGRKKRDILNSILSNCFADLIYNDDGKLAIVIDQKESTPIALINEQNVSSITYAKTFQRTITGLKTTYTNRDSWAVATEYFMKNGSNSYDLSTDTLSELSLEYVTTHAHAYKIAQRKMRQLFLQPRLVTVNVGLEGDYYPLYSTVLFQTARLKQGICSAVIHKVKYDDAGLIKGFTLSDAIEFVDTYRYGIIVQAQNLNGRNLFYAEITGTGKTREVTLVQHKSNQYVIEYGNIASIGLLNDDGSFNSVTNLMKITGIKAGSNHGWELELKDYNEEIYEYGTIPAYKSNLTKRPTTAQTLPTIKAVDVDEAKYSTWAETKELVAGLEAQIEGIVTETTVCAASVTSFVFDIDDSGKTLDEQTIETEITLKHNDDELDFTIGTINLPEGFSYEVVGNKLSISVGIGTVIKAGLIEVPVIYKAVVGYDQYVDKNGIEYADEDGEIYAIFDYSQTSTTWKLYLNYLGSGLCVYLGKKSQLSELPSVTNIGSYFVWAGENRKASSLAEDGYFLQAQTYKFVGTSKNWKWEIDDNALHNQAALSDVLSITNADLKTNNSTVWAYLDHLTSNSVYADMLVANEGFIEQLASKIITADLVTTDTFIAGMDSLAFNLDLHLSNNTAMLREEIETAQANAEDYVFTQLGLKELQSYTIIKGGYIDTGLINAQVLLADYVKTSELTTGNLTVKGKFEVTKGLNFSNKYIISAVSSFNNVPITYGMSPCFAKISYSISKSVHFLGFSAITVIIPPTIEQPIPKGYLDIYGITETNLIPIPCILRCWYTNSSFTTCNKLEIVTLDGNVTDITDYLFYYDESFIYI